MNTKAFAALCSLYGVLAPTEEFRFHPKRKWCFDFAWPEQKIALEVEGGIWTRGRHTRPAGFLRDIEKYNEAAILGWRILRTPPNSLLSVGTIENIKRAMR